MIAIKRPDTETPPLPASLEDGDVRPSQVIHEAISRINVSRILNFKYPPVLTLIRFYSRTLNQTLVVEVDKLADNADMVVADDTALKSHMEAVVQTLRQAPASAKDLAMLAVAQKSVAMLYRTQTRVGREVFVGLLESICLLTPKVAQEVSQWLLYAEDEVSFDFLQG